MNGLQVIEHNGQRVLTTAQLAESYQADKQQISKNFTRNIERYKQDKHYFALEGNEKREFINRVQIDDGSKNAKTLYLWTEKGAWLHAKSLNTDKAWDAYELLVDDYYRIKEQSKAFTLASYMIDDPIQRAKQWIIEQEEKQQLQLELKEAQPKVSYYDSILRSKDLLTITQIASDYGMTAQALNKKLKDMKIQYKQSGQWLLYAKYKDEGYVFSHTNLFTHSDGREGSNQTTKWSQKGRLFLYEELKKEGILPTIEKEYVEIYN